MEPRELVERLHTELFASGDPRTSSYVAVNRISAGLTCHRTFARPSPVIWCGGDVVPITVSTGVEVLGREH